MSKEAHFRRGPMEGAPGGGTWGRDRQESGHQGQQTYLVSSRNRCPLPALSQALACGSLMPAQLSLCGYLWPG